MNDTQKAAKLADGLKAAALKSGMIDLDGLKLADTSTVTLEDTAYGMTVVGAEALMAKLKESKPYLFAKHCREMSEPEKAEALAAILRPKKPEPVPMPAGKTTAKDLTAAERQQYLTEHQRRFG
jgi:hypothetical protein